MAERLGFLASDVRGHWSKLHHDMHLRDTSDKIQTAYQWTDTSRKKLGSLCVGIYIYEWCPGSGPFQKTQQLYNNEDLFKLRKH